jgi:NAD(P)-dependent dehydrogenase (short-subunit alcohol dehydrogenase family)
MELGDRGITANTVSPGSTQTEMVANSGDDKLLHKNRRYSGMFTITELRLRLLKIGVIINW